MRENLDSVPIQLPTLKRLWKIRFVDSLDIPKVSSVILIRGGDTVMDAATKAKKTEGWAAFSAKFPDAAVSAVEFHGLLEN